MAWNVYGYEKRVTVKPDGEVKVTHHALFHADDDETDVDERQIARSTYSMAKKRGGYEFSVTVIVPERMPVVRM